MDIEFFFTKIQSKSRCVVCTVFKERASVVGDRVFCSQVCFQYYMRTDGVYDHDEYRIYNLPEFSSNSKVVTSAQSPCCSNLSEEVEEMSLCFLCEEEAKLDCPRCEGVRWVEELDIKQRRILVILLSCSFCSEAHQRLHLGEDGSCLPYQIVTTTLAGKSVIATRDIHPGELIFR